MKKGKVIAIVLSGGVGSRIISDMPKQYVKVGDRMVISYCLETLMLHPQIDALRIVAAEEWRNPILDEMESLNIPMNKFEGFVEPGDSRQGSVVNSIKAVIDDIGFDEISDERVLIHDAARPCVTAEHISTIIEASEEHEGVMPALPMKDTVYLSDDGVTVTRLFEKNRIYSGHTPEVFDLKKYYNANILLVPGKIKLINGSSEPAVMAGMDVAMVAGDEDNFKITTMADLEKFKEMIKMRGIEKQG